MDAESTVGAGGIYPDSVGGPPSSGLVFPSLYVIMDADLLPTAARNAGGVRLGRATPGERTGQEACPTELAIAAMLADSGVKLIQYRNKQATPRNLFLISRELAGFLSPRGVRFIVNDRPDVAALAGAGGVHVGQEDLGVEQARAICGKEAWVGISTHNLEQVAAAAKTSAGYIAVGPVFPTATKVRPEPVVGCDLVREARQLTEKPIVAIGGITLENAESVFREGADSVAVARDILTAANPGKRAGEFLDLAAKLGVGRS